MESYKIEQNTETNEHFLSSIYIEYPPAKLDYFKYAIRLPKFNQINKETLNSIYQEWIKDRKWSYILDKKDLLEASDISVDYLLVLNGLKEERDWDYILKNCEFFKKIDENCNLQSIFNGLKSKNDWDSILTNYHIFELNSIKIDLLEIYSGLKEKQYWFSILNSKDFFIKNEIEISPQEIYTGLKERADWNSIFNFRDYFTNNNINIDYLEILSGLITNNELGLIFENQYIFEKNNIETNGLKIYNELIIKNDWSTIIKNRDYFDDLGINIDIKNIFNVNIENKNWDFIIKNLSLFLKENIDINEEIVKNIYKTVNDIHIFFLEQRYDILFLFKKYGLLEISDIDSEKLYNGLEKDGRYETLKVINKLSNKKDDDIQTKKDNYNFELIKCNINEEIIEFYILQMIRAEIVRIKDVPDYKDKLKSEHLMFFKSCEEFIKEKNHYITKVLREHILFIVLERVRRSKIEKKANFQIPNFEEAIKTYSSGEMKDLLASIIGLFTYLDIDTPWIQIAYAGYNIWSDNEISDSLLDYIFSLEHNNGSVFTRGNKIIVNEQQCRTILDIKRDAVNINNLLDNLEKEKISFSLQSKIIWTLKKIKSRLNID